MDTYYLSLPGTSQDQLDTPSLLIDLPTMEGNLQRMQDFFKGRTANLRPHGKTHKSPIIAHMQLQHGAIGICCAKVGEAEVMARGGIKNIFITNQVIGDIKISRLMSLCRTTNVIVAVDDPFNVHHLSEAAQSFGVTLAVAIEINVRIDRCGVEPGIEAVKLARLISRSPGLNFAGLMGYEGQVRIPDINERTVETNRAMAKLLAATEAIETEGIAVPIVSAGGTSTYSITGNTEGITEVQAGSYVFMDAAYRYVPEFNPALTLLSTVISRPRKSAAIVDAGVKAISTDEGLPEVLWPHGVKVKRLSEEHGRLELAGEEASQLRPGDKVLLLPSHCDTTINLHDYYYAIRNGMLEAVWPIEGRGKFR